MRSADNSTSSLEGFQSFVFSWAMIQSIIIITANTILLFFSCKIPDQTKKPLHILYTVLGAADLFNGIICMLLAVRYYFQIAFFQRYFICFCLMLMTHSGITTTGFTLLLLSLKKCISIVYPLKSLHYITRNVAIVSSAGVWIFSFTVITVSFSLLRTRNFIGITDSCSMETILGDNHGQYVKVVGFGLGTIFSVGFAAMNLVIVYIITERGKKVGSWISGQVRAKNEDKQPTITNEREKTCKTIGTVVTSPSVAVGQMKSNVLNAKSSERKIDQNKNSFHKKRSKNFKAYITVLIHILAYMVCGLPTLVLTTNKSLSWYFYKDINVIFLATLFMYMSSLINPFLTIFRVPVFQKIANKTIGRMRRGCRFNL